MGQAFVHCYILFMETGVEIVTHDWQLYREIGRTAKFGP